MPGSTFNGDPNPSFDCLERGHIWYCISYEGELWVRTRPWLENELAAVASWCPWCGSGTYDSEALPGVRIRLDE